MSENKYSFHLSNNSKELVADILVKEECIICELNQNSFTLLLDGHFQIDKYGKIIFYGARVIQSTIKTNVLILFLSRSIN